MVIIAHFSSLKDFSASIGQETRKLFNLFFTVTTSTSTTTTVIMTARALGPALSPAAGGLDQWEESLVAGLDQWEGLEGPRQGLDGAVWKISMPICSRSFA